MRKHQFPLYHKHRCRTLILTIGIGLLIASFATMTYCLYALNQDAAIATAQAAAEVTKNTTVAATVTRELRDPQVRAILCAR